ncbi:MAG: HAD family phosphatase [Bacteroidales bacterium]|nr:HAD family phosphatase [Bacteroidales bacterium]
MKFKAVIFDFNGTLFWDTKYHNQAWNFFLKKHGLELTDAEKAAKIHGKPNRDIFKGLFKNTLTDDEILKMTHEKENLYRDICKNIQLELAPGANDFVNFLNKNNIQFAIATSSGWENVSFYIETLKLENWIPLENIIFDDGSFKGKPNPDIFHKAMQKIGQNPENVLIFEDSKTGIQAAEKAKAGGIIIVDSNGDDYSDFSYRKINNFNQIDRKLFVD